MRKAQDERTKAWAPWTPPGPCTCEGRSLAMLLWARHYEGCPEVKRWGLQAVPRLAAVAVLVALVGCAGAPVAGSGAPGERPCGVERWTVKTATDGVQLREASPLPVRTVAELAALPAPKYREGRPREGAELDMVAVEGHLLAVRLAEDGDLHFVLADTPDGPTMVAEVPDPNCAAGSPYASRMADARQAAATALGAVFGRKFRDLRTAPRARLTGAVFFDKVHGQRGVATNGVELHPVLGFEALPAAPR